MKQNLLIICLFFSLGVAFGQTKLQKADRHYKDLAFIQAAKEYAEYLSNEKKPSAETLLNAAESNYCIGNTNAAAQLYEQAYSLQGVKISDKYFNHYILTLRGEENYAKADELLLQRFEYKGTDLTRQQFNSQKKYLDSISKLKPKFAVTNIANNTALADFGTAFYGDKIVYASAKDAMRDGAKKYSWNQQPYLTLYVADKDTVTGNFTNEKKFLSAAQTSYHNAAPAFSPNFKTVYATVNNIDKHRKLQNDKKGTNNVQLVYGQIKTEILVSKTIAAFNSPDYSVGQPAVSPDGKWLYFTSDMPGGYGETDIYMAEIFNDGTFGKPKNAGRIINTTGREMFPFISNDVLYFASDGHYGLGGLDVFSSAIIKKTTFAQPKNMGKPINSNRDDFAFIINRAGINGYVSSNRAGGKGDDDIYYISLAKDCNHTVNGTIVNQANKQPLAGVTVKAVDSSGQVQANVITDSKGFYVITLPCDAKVIIEASTPDYTIEKTDVAGTLEPHTTIINFELKPYASLVVNQGGVERIDINPIYFDFDKYNVRKDAAAELDKVVYVLQKFPNVIINIESHTDSRGIDTYNMELSDNRAKATYNYIISKGINPKQIQSVNGYGETRLLNKCSNGVNCTNEEHQLNRRSDFVIVIK